MAEAQRTNLLACSANWLVVLVEDDADLVHQADLLLIVTGQGLGAGVNVGEETEHSLSRDGLGSDGCCC